MQFLLLPFIEYSISPFDLVYVDAKPSLSAIQHEPDSFSLILQQFRELSHSIFEDLVVYPVRLHCSKLEDFCKIPWE